MSDVTVITATMPGREALLAEAMASVVEQTLAPADHLITVDYVRRGGARPRNLLAAAVATPWLATLDDDDKLYPQHLKRLMAVADEADVVYSWCDTSGPDPWTAYNLPFAPELLRRQSIVSHVALVRARPRRRRLGRGRGVGLAVLGQGPRRRGAVRPGP